MLDSIRLALQALDAPPRVFFRDDDADRDIRQLRTLLELFARHEAPLSLAVIPGTLEPPCANMLLHAAARQPLELHQHGWMHVNHESEGRKCEFGPARSMEQQRGDIALGKQRLAEYLGASTAPIFTPPWNRCTEVTCQAIDDLGFRAISTIRQSAMVARPASLADVPVTVDLFRWKEGPRLKSEEDLAAEIRKALPGPEPIGILLHHKAMSEDAFSAVDGLLAAFGAARARFHDMEDLCPRRS